MVKSMTHYEEVSLEIEDLTRDFEFEQTGGTALQLAFARKFVLTIPTKKFNDALKSCGNGAVAAADPHRISKTLRYLTTVVEFLENEQSTTPTTNQHEQQAPT